MSVSDKIKSFRIRRLDKNRNIELPVIKDPAGEPIFRLFSTDWGDISEFMASSYSEDLSPKTNHHLIVDQVVITKGSYKSQAKV